ncbi:hypothetical protein F0562_009218 [Nyssa sinensis]|uniref:RING-type domain-containing protein n=1 Tax=Nyssa sinensis TaxID=561372 RepID=A0A5J4ZVL6_9ASTE|nr:hypothetical protein F0562_009218 [Nyssa sinensis]
MPTDDYKDDRRHANVRLNPNPGAASPTGAQHPPPPPKPNPRFLSLLLQAIIMAVIISLFLLFLGVAAVVLLHIFFVAGVHRHHIRRRASEFSDTATPSHSANDLQKFLPSQKYAAGLPEAAKDCPVCLESFKEGEWCRSLPVCNHMFHENCVDKWLTKVLNCPICRSRVLLNSEASSSGVSDDDWKLLWAVGV